MFNSAQEFIDFMKEAVDDPALADQTAVRKLMKSVQEELVNLSEFIKNFQDITPLQGLSPKIQAIRSLDPTKQVFDSQTDFINYSQQYSDAMNDFLTEFKKPEVRKVFNEIADKITKNQGDILPRLRFA